MEQVLDCILFVLESAEYVVTLDSFRELLDGLENQQRQMEQLQPSTDVGVIQINIEKLKAGLLPSPVSCLREMNNMLPQVRKQYPLSPPMDLCSKFRTEEVMNVTEALPWYNLKYVVLVRTLQAPVAVYLQ